MKEFTLEIITPSKPIFSGTVVSVTVPGSLGNFQILYNHAPIMSSLDIGRVKIEFSNGEEKLFITGGGTIEVLNNRVTILAESFESKEDIDLARAERALQRAKERLAMGNKANIDIARAQASLNRALNRIKFKNYNW